MSDFDSINLEQRLYVLRTGHGYTCLGFDVAEKWIQGVLQWLPADKWPLAAEGETDIGTQGRYEFYCRVMSVGAEHAAATKTRCPAQLTPQLIGLEGKRVKVTAPDGTVSRFNVGKSTGWLPIHLEIKRRDSTGGCGVYLPEGATVELV